MNGDTRLHDALHDAVMRALDEAGVYQAVLRGMCLEVALDSFNDALAASSSGDAWRLAELEALAFDLWLGSQRGPIGRDYLDWQLARIAAAEVNPRYTITDAGRKALAGGE